MVSQKATNLDKLFPFAGNNAIETAAIALSWNGPRDDRLFAPFLEQEAKLRAQGYSDPEVIRAFEVAFNQAGLDSRASVKAGYTFIKKNAYNAPLREVTLRDNQFLFTVRDYGRWEQFLADAEMVLAPMLELLKKYEKEITLVSLQYQDKFLWRDIENAFPVHLALKDSGFIPLDKFADSHQWHSNQGFFVSSTNDLPHRLDNINLTLALENNILTLGVLTVHQYGPLSLFGEELTSMTLKPMLEAAHAANKGYIQDLLADELCQKIGLRSSS